MLGHTDAADAVFDLIKRAVAHAALRMLKKRICLALADNYNDAEACTRSSTSKDVLPSIQYLLHKIHNLCTTKDDLNAVCIIPLAVIVQHWWPDSPRVRGEAF